MVGAAECLGVTKKGAWSRKRLRNAAIGQSHEANLRIPCSVKTLQYRVRKCVHEGKPRATNRSRVNPITVQCKVDKSGNNRYAS